jgi:pyoverdine/dityrosine biosynthesis protein Dit1
LRGGKQETLVFFFPQFFCFYPQSSEDSFIHFQLLRFCQATRLQHINSHILLENRCVLQQQHVDVFFFPQFFCFYPQSSEDSFIHFQLLRFCQATRVPHINSHILLENRCVLQQQHVDVKIADALLKKGTKQHADGWDSASKD